jgi:hypothetical protein
MMSLELKRNIVWMDTHQAPSCLQKFSADKREGLVVMLQGALAQNSLLMIKGAKLIKAASRDGINAAEKY